MEQAVALFFFQLFFRVFRLHLTSLDLIVKGKKILCSFQFLWQTFFSLYLIFNDKILEKTFAGLRNEVNILHGLVNIIFLSVPLAKKFARLKKS